MGADLVQTQRVLHPLLRPMHQHLLKLWVKRSDTHDRHVGKNTMRTHCTNYKYDSTYPVKLVFCTLNNTKHHIQHRVGFVANYSHVCYISKTLVMW